MPSETARVGVIGLGSMGMGMARSLLRAGLDVAATDIQEARRQGFAHEGGRAVGTPREAADGAGIVVSVVVNAAQTEEILFGENGVLAAMREGAAFVCCSTVSPAFVREIAQKAEAKGVHYLDAPVSGGEVKAAEGALTIMASGSPEAFRVAGPALDAMADKCYRIGDEPGAGSAMKMINQLLAGVHIAAACEAVALAVKAGLDPTQVYNVISNAAGSSWMFENRVPHILDGDYQAKSAVEIFTKDLGIVLDTARSESFPVPMAGAAMQMFLMAAAAGMGKDDDASVVRVYERLAGIELPRRKPAAG